jgi:outer membrane protein assembly factor BamB
MRNNVRIPALILIAIGLNYHGLWSSGSGWPTWRYDHGRSGYAEITLPADLSLLWTRQLEEPGRCWPLQLEDYHTGGNPDQIGKLSFDISYEPVMGGGRLFVPSMVSDRVTAYSASGGEELWRFYAGGPVRFAPVYDSGRVYFVSDDGYLYCLEASTGKLLWQFHGSYSHRMVLGNERIISMWPARGAPVIRDGKIYFAAGVMPFEGIFVHALSAETGEMIWTNSTSGAIWTLHQHGGAWSYGGPSPQGYLAISGNRLIVPGGRTVPAVFDIETGEFLYYNQATAMVGKGAGGYRVFASDGWFVNHGILYALEDGAQYGHVPADIITGNSFIGLSGNELIAHGSQLEVTETEAGDRLQRGVLRKKYQARGLWKVEMNADRLFFQAGSHFAVSRDNGRSAALIAVTSEGMPGEIVWEHKVEGEIWTMIAGDGKIYVVTLEGKIYCFGTAVPGRPAIHFAYKSETPAPDRSSLELAASIIRKTGINGGYGMICGGNDTGLIMALANSSKMHFVVSEPDAGKAVQLRQSLDNAGIYGKRVSVLNSNQGSTAFLPYIYELIVLNGNSFSDDQFMAAFNSLRPYGGAMVITGAGNETEATFRRHSLFNGSFTTGDGFAMITREGALPGSAQWTHQNGSSSNRTYSDDDLVKSPLGTLWFGGPSNHNALPRHRSGPLPQIAGGRLVLLGVETISARCVYTGRELWVREMPGIGQYFTSPELEQKFSEGIEVFMGGQSGANFMGSPYVTLEDAVYVIYGNSLLSLDASTGTTVMEIRLPEAGDLKVNEFGCIMVSGDYLVATVDPQIFDEGVRGMEDNWNATSSRILLAMNRHTGETLWSRKAEKGFRHNAIVVGNNNIFIIDGLSSGATELLKRRGTLENAASRLVALELDSGRELWSVEDDIFGTWLGYYEERDILLQGGRFSQGRMKDEPRDRLIAHDGATGRKLWENNQGYHGPLGLHPDMILSGKPGEPTLDPSSGENILRPHPLTGEKYQWNWHKYYGCGTMNTSRHLVLFRSGTAGFADLLDFGGTTNFGGFRSGCTNSLIAADGILSSPDYTRTCTCSYPMQTSVGLVHLPGAGIEMWAINRLDAGNRAIQSLGINFGAQGNRKENDVLWLEYPRVYNLGPDLPVTVESGELSWFRNHATWIKGGDEKFNWVGSYGMKGMTSVSVRLDPDNFAGEKYYNITLYFTEPDDLSPGERIFDISLQGTRVLQNFDIAGEAGGARHLLKKEFRRVKVDGSLNIKFSGIVNLPVISGIEIIMDEPAGLSLQ